MYHDTLIRIKNSQAANRERVRVPFSKMDQAILDVLLKYHYLKEVSKRGRGVKKILEVYLSYADDGRPKISQVKFLSRPSRRIYVGYQSLKPVRQGYGLGIISTSKGIMEAREARKAKLGGEYLFEVW